MAARADNVSRVDHDGVTLVEGATSDVRFAFTERTGGVSEDAYSSLNLGSHVGDDPFAVQENRRRVLEAMGATECEHNLLVPNQVHGDHIVTVTSSGADDLEAVREQIDRSHKEWLVLGLCGKLNEIIKKPDPISDFVDFMENYLNDVKGNLNDFDVEKFSEVTSALLDNKQEISAVLAKDKKE